jgi:hypothetical protein
MDRVQRQNLWSDPKRTKIPKAVLSRIKKLLHKEMYKEADRCSSSHILTKDVVLPYKQNENVGSLQFLPDGEPNPRRPSRVHQRSLVDSLTKSTAAFKRKKAAHTVDVFGVQVMSERNVICYGRIDIQRAAWG